MRILIVALMLAVAAPAVAHAAPKSHCTSGKCAKKRAKKLLSGRVLIKFTETTGSTNYTSLDQRLHLCGNGDYVYDSVSYIEATGTTTEQRYTGRWKVRKAHLSRNGKRGTARLRGTPDGGGQATVVTIKWKNGSVRLDGAEVIADRSDLC